MRKVAVIVLLIMIIMNLTACYDANELDDVIHVVAIGIDKGVSDKWRLTLQFPTMKEGGGTEQSGSSSGKSQDEYTCVSIDAPSFFAGINMLNTSLPRKLNFMHAQIILFSEELAESGLINEFIAPINRFREIRKTSHVFVVKGKVFDFMKDNKPFIGNLLSKSFQLLIKEGAMSGYFPHVTLESFSEGLVSTYHQPIAAMAAVNDAKSFEENGEPWGTKFKTGGDYMAGKIPRTGDNKIEIWGTALFIGDTMVGELNGDETRYLLMARGEFERGFFTVQDPEEPGLAISLDIRNSTKPKVRVTLDGLKPVISLNVQIDGDLLAVQSGIDYEKPEHKTLLEQAFRQIVKDGIEKLIDKCKSFNTDVLLFGDYAAKNFLTIQDWENYDWNSHFKEADVMVNIEFTIRRTGTQVEN
jgi:spore germination protein KC